MTSKEIVKRTLEKWRFPVLQESDTMVIIRYQLSYVQIGSLQDDSQGITVTLSGAFNADSKDKVRLALRTCNELNHQLMQVKFYLDEDNDLIIAAEFLYHDDEDVEYLLDFALHSVVIGKQRFQKQYCEVTEEDNLLQELDNDISSN